MKEFLEALSAGLVGFPPTLALILVNAGSALAGAVVTTIVLWLTTVPALSNGYLFGHFIVCWLTGGIMGPAMVAPVAQSLFKLPTYAICFLTSGSGWWIWTKLVPKQQEKLLNNQTPPPDGGTPP